MSKLGTLAAAATLGFAFLVLLMPPRDAAEPFQEGNPNEAQVILYGGPEPKTWAFDLGAYAGDPARLLARAKGASQEASTTTDEELRLMRMLEVQALATAAGNAPAFEPLVAQTQAYLQRGGMYAAVNKVPVAAVAAAPAVRLSVCRTPHPPAAVYGTIDAPLANLADLGLVPWSS